MFYLLVPTIGLIDDWKHTRLHTNRACGYFEKQEGKFKSQFDQRLCTPEATRDIIRDSVARYTNGKEVLAPRAVLYIKVADKGEPVFDYWDFEFPHPIFDGTTTQTTRSVRTPTGDCIHNVTPEPYTEEMNLQPQCLLDHVMINTETTAEITDKCTTKITSNNPIQMSGKRSTTTMKEGRGEESSIPKKHSQETSKNEKPGNAPKQHKDWKKYFDTIAEKLQQRIAESAGNTECSSSNGSDTDSYKSKENTPEATGGANLGTTKEETSPGRKREVGSPSSNIGSTEWVNREPELKKLCK